MSNAIAQTLDAPVAERVSGEVCRSPGGRFAPGNKGGPGNPHAATVGRYRAAILKCCTPEDVVDVFRAMMDKAKAGDVAAAKVVLDRVLGPNTALLVSTPEGVTFQLVSGE